MRRGRIKFLRSLKRRDLDGRRVLLRLDLDVPLYHGQITETFRLERARGTLQYLKKRGAKTIIIGHLGEGGESLEPLARYFRRERVRFFPAWPTTTELEFLKPGQIIMLDNLRRQSGERDNNPDFVERLSRLGEIYVNEAFATSHRLHASIIGLPARLPSCGGLVWEQEIKNLSRVFKPRRPFLFILGGAKAASKIPLIKKFLRLADAVFVGGATAQAFFRARRLSVGQSVVEPVTIPRSVAYHRKLVLPADLVVESNSGHHLRHPQEIGRDDVVYDIGPAAGESLLELIKKAKLIVWNGPLGYFEKGYSQATIAAARAVAESRAVKIVGGGDTIAAISQLGLSRKFSWLSTGGGAMIEFLATGRLAGIEALENSKVKWPR